MPKLEKVDLDKFASERDRQLAEADLDATNRRLSEIKFDFSW
jgi:hypothetical protein